MNDSTAQRYNDLALFGPLRLCSAIYPGRSFPRGFFVKPRRNSAPLRASLRALRYHLSASIFLPPSLGAALSRCVFALKSVTIRLRSLLFKIRVHLYYYPSKFSQAVQISFPRCNDVTHLTHVTSASLNSCPFVSIRGF